MSFSGFLPPRKPIPSFWNPAHQGYVFLHLGENPFPPTEPILHAISQAAQNANRYPDADATILRKKLADYVGFGVTAKNIWVGNGSDELIDLAIVSFTAVDQGILTFDPTFFVYTFAAKRHGVPVYSLPRAEDYALPASENLFGEKTSPPESAIALTFIANPNNPTGTLTPRRRVREVMEKLPGIVVIDECYYEFCGETMADLVHEHERLIIFRSLSKSFGLSGLRLGYAVAHERLIDTLARHAMTFPVNALAQAAGIAALEQVDVYRRQIEELKYRRDQLQRELSQLGFSVLPSHTNFLLALAPENFVPVNPAKTLAEKGLLVSDQTSTPGISQPAIRIAVGTEKENRRLIEMIRGIIASYINVI